MLSNRPPPYSTSSCLIPSIHCHLQLCSSPSPYSLLLLSAAHSLRPGLPTRRAQRSFQQRSDHSVTYSGVSTQCQNTVVAVAADPRSQCLNPGDLLKVFVTGSDGSIVAPVDTWLKGLCSRGPCSNDDLAFIATNVTTGCAQDFGNISPDTVVPIVQKIYPTARKAACLAE